MVVKFLVKSMSLFVKFYRIKKSILIWVMNNIKEKIISLEFLGFLRSVKNLRRVMRFLKLDNSLSVDE